MTSDWHPLRRQQMAGQRPRASGVRGTLYHSVHLQPMSGFWQGGDVGPAVATHRPCGHEDGNSSWARNEWKCRHTPDAVLTCWGSVDTIQIRSEATDSSQSEDGIGRWTDYLGDRRVRKFTN